MPFSAVDAISPAIEHTRRQLFQPFRLGQWWRLALVGLLVGELSSGGGCNVPHIPNFNVPRHPGNEHFLPSISGIDPMLYAGLILTVIFAGLVLGIVFMYISSVMRFVLFDSILARECHIRQRWIERQGPGWRYFLWKLLYAFLTLGVLVVLIGIPAAFAYSAGWLKQPKEHLPPLILLGVALFFVIVIVTIAMAVIFVLTKDFVVPQMALENIGVVEGWRRLWALMNAEKGGYIGYVGMKILLAIGAGIVLGIVGFIFALIIFVPAAGIAVAAVIAAKSAGVGWTAYTITLAIVSGSMVVALFLVVTALISVPAIVFFPAYSIYFFAARYPALGAALYPASPPAAWRPMSPLASPPPSDVPPLPPNPEPIG